MKNYTEYFKPKEYDIFSTINEAGLSRIVDKIKISGEDFAILTGWRNTNTFQQNRKNNQDIIKKFNSMKMGPYLLVGHWQESPDDMNYDEAKSKNLTKDVVEDSILVVRKPEITKKDFVDLILNLSKEYKQDAVIISINKDIRLYFKNGEYESIGKNLTLNKISQSFSQMRNKPNVPFVFEGTIHPTNNMSKLAFDKMGLKWIQ